MPLITAILRLTGGHIPGGQVPETWVNALEVVNLFRYPEFRWMAFVAFGLWNQTRPSFRKDSDIKVRLRLVFPMDGNAVGWICV